MHDLWCKGNDKRRKMKMAAIDLNLIFVPTFVYHGHYQGQPGRYRPAGTNQLANLFRFFQSPKQAGKHVRLYGQSFYARQTSIRA